MRKFVVISTQRTGSTLLIKLLDSHPEVLCAGEIFYPPSGSEYAIRRYIDQSLGRSLKNQIARRRLVKEFLDDFYSQQGYSAIGFKFMYSQARHIPRCYPSVMRYLEDNHIHVIHGVRNNLLRVVLSRVSSKSSGVYRSTTPVERKPIYLPPKALVKELSRLREEGSRWEDRLSSLPYMQVDYESLMSNRGAEEQRILEFVGAEKAAELTSPFTKLAAKGVKEMIQNYDEVARELCGTEFEWCLEDEGQ
jgi:LPS sulfotransferase NodH